MKLMQHEYRTRSNLHAAAHKDTIENSRFYFIHRFEKKIFSGELCS